ncbi:MAG: nitroreductase family protein [Pseudolabrys sp.]
MKPDFIRRELLTGAVALAATSLVGQAGAQTPAQLIKLSAPRIDGGIPLMQALAKRRSIRAYSDRPLEQPVLSDLMWAAFGINRPESADRTAPSWRHSIETDIYVCRADGVFLFMPKAHELRRVLDTDIRKFTSSMVFAATAPAVLVYAADLARMAKAPRQEQVLNAHVDSAIIGQNVYLFCASAGLGTVILGSIDRAGLPKRMGLRDDQIVTFAQPVGYPK